MPIGTVGGPLRLETLVGASGFRGTCYRAANWLMSGKPTKCSGPLHRQPRMTQNGFAGASHW